MTITMPFAPSRALRWDFVTDPPTRLLADLEAARLRLRRGQYRSARTGARRLLRTFRAGTSLGSSNKIVAVQLAEIRASATAVRAIAAAQLSEPEAGEAIAESLAAFSDLLLESLRPPALALYGMVLALSGRSEESVEPLVLAAMAGEDMLTDLVRTAAEALNAAGSFGDAVRLLKAVHERYPREPALLSDLAEALSATGDAAAVAEASVAAGALYAELQQFALALRYFALAESHVPDHALAWLGRCQTLAATGRLTEALSAVADLQRRQPELAGAHAVEAITLMRAGRGVEAESVVDRALGLFPDDPWLLDTRIRLSIASDELDTALRAIDKALQVDNTDREWQCLRAEVLLAREPDNTDAVQLLQDLAAAIPDEVTPTARVASALAAAGDPVRALRAVERAIDDHHADPELLALQVQLLSTVGRHREAVALARQSLSRRLDTVAFALPLAESLLATDRYEEAVAAADLVIAIEPESPRAHRTRGMARYRLQRYDEALLDLDLPSVGSDQDRDAALGDTLTQVGVREAKSGERAVARRLLERAVEIEPTNVLARAGLAELLRVTGDYADALRHAELGLEVTPENPTLIGTRGQILHGLHNDRHAEEELRRALDIDPNLAWARTELGDLLRMKRQYLEAIHHLELAVKVAPDDPWPRACKGAAEYSLDRYDMAGESLDRALELKEDYGWAHGVKAAVLKDIDRMHEAATHADRSLELDPALGWVWEVRGTLWLHAMSEPEADEDRTAASSAKLCYSRALEIDSQLWEALIGLSESMMLLEEADAGLLGLHQVVQLLQHQDAADADSQTGLGWSQLRLRNYDDAVDAFVRALALDSRHVSASFDLCLALLCRKDVEVAFEEFSQAAARLKTVRHPGRRRFLTRRARRDLSILAADHQVAPDHAHQALGKINSVESRHA
jgi:tetratricopeptide (TPR) repeat protein